MTGEDVISEIVTNTPILEESIKNLITILQVIGGLLGVYIIFWVINFFINLRRMKLLKEIKKDIKILDKKVDKVLKKRLMCLIIF